MQFYKVETLISSVSLSPFMSTCPFVSYNDKERSGDDDYSTMLNGHRRYLKEARRMKRTFVFATANCSSSVVSALKAIARFCIIKKPSSRRVLISRFLYVFVSV